jgi:hypothetical protein
MDFCAELVALRAIERMRIALMLEYQKSVNSHTLYRLHTWYRATRSFGKIFNVNTGSTLLWLRHD